MVWVAGFPCTPYSALHSGSALLAEPEARQFYESVARFKNLQAPVSRHIEQIQKRLTQLGLLENVIGLHRVKNQIMNHLMSELPSNLATIFYSLSAT